MGGLIAWLKEHAAAVGILVTILATSIAGAYKVGYDTGASNLESYKELNGMNVTGLAKEMDRAAQAASAFVAQLERIQAYDQVVGSLEDEVKRLSESIKQLQAIQTVAALQISERDSEIASLKGAINEYSAIISKLRGEVQSLIGDSRLIRLEEGESDWVLLNKMRIGLISATSKAAEITVGTEQRRMTSGETLDANNGCTIFVSSVAWGAASFVISCSNSERDQ